MSVALATFCLLLSQVATGDQGIDFDTEIMPVFSVAGCNAAACHGAAKGQAGFQLSLFGGDPSHDYQSIVRELEGRRINLFDSEQSLLLLKATEEVAHGGGQRFPSDSESADVLRKWVDQGALAGNPDSWSICRIDPTAVTLQRPGKLPHFYVTAQFADGTTRDVSSWAVYWTSDDSALPRGAEGDYQLARPGRYWLFVRYLSRIARVPVSAPVGEHPVEVHRLMRRNWIDDCVNATLTELRLTPSPLADDATFVRRIYLDLTGRLPSPDQSETFVRSVSPKKRQELIDCLLRSDAFVDYWTYRLGQWLRFHLPAGDRTAAEALYAWLRQQVADNRGWDQIAQELLLAEGDSQTYGPAAFHRLANDPRQEAEFVSEVMLGVRLRCANCHNHPLDRWTQDDYHGLAQVFACVQRGPVVSRSASGFVVHPRTGEAAQARIPGGPDLVDATEPLRDVTQWITSPENPYFAQAMVGRLWRTLMGRGLIDPVDDTRATNPASDPELLTALTEDFVKGEFQLRRTIRAICDSAAYQRSSVPLAHDPAGEQFFAHALRRPLSAEVLADAITDVTGVGDHEDVSLRTISLIEPGSAAETLRVLGRCDFTAGCLPETSTRPMGIATRLELINGSLLNARIESSNGIVRRLIEQQLDDEDIVRTLYLLALSRKPTTDELRDWCHELGMAGDSSDRRQRIEDFVWSLLNCQDFITNH